MNNLARKKVFPPIVAVIAILLLAFAVFPQLSADAGAQEQLERFPDIRTEYAGEVSLPPSVLEAQERFGRVFDIQTEVRAFRSGGEYVKVYQYIGAQSYAMLPLSQFDFDRAAFIPMDSLVVDAEGNRALIAESVTYEEISAEQRAGLEFASPGWSCPPHNWQTTVWHEYIGSVWGRVGYFNLPGVGNVPVYDWIPMYREHIITWCAWCGAAPFSANPEETDDLEETE